MTVFVRTRMNIDVVHANYYLGSLFYGLSRLMTNGIAEISLTAARLSVFYKQRELYFYPAWAYAIPTIILKIPFSLLDAFLWTVLTYYVIGYSPEPERCALKYKLKLQKKKICLLISLSSITECQVFLSIPSSILRPSSIHITVSFDRICCSGSIYCINIGSTLLTSDILIWWLHNQKK